MKLFFGVFIVLFLIVQLGFSQDANTSLVLRKMLTENNIQQNDAIHFEIANYYVDTNLGLQHLYLQQTWKGIKIYNAIQSLVFKNNILQYQAGFFDSSIAGKAKQPANVLPAQSALDAAAKALAIPYQPENTITVAHQKNTANQKTVYRNSHLSDRNINLELVWLSNSSVENTLQLAWSLGIYAASTQEYWNIAIDAGNGNLMSKNNFTVYENPSTNQQTSNKPVQFPFATQETLPNISSTKNIKKGPTTAYGYYNVVPYPYESRFDGAIALETNPWVKAGNGSNATSYGWHYDGFNNYNYTRGNNVFAYDDSLKLNMPGRADTSTTSGGTLTFNRTPNFTQQAFTTGNRQFATDNLFYWNNLMHDLFYLYGFTEAAGNFQNDNLNRGGADSDYVKAEAQDGNGLSNANFSTPPDGYSGRMQMYLYTPASALITVNSPTSIAGNYFVREGNISPNNLLNIVGTKTGTLVFFNDSLTATTTHNACKAPVNNIAGKIVFINVATCTFITQIKNAQNAGAIGVVMCSKSNTYAMTGTDSSITIPAVMISSTDGATIAAQLSAGNIVNMTLFAPVYFDGALDNGIVCHEYAHGISNRLTGGNTTSACLLNKEQGSEGWSDYIGLMMNTNWKKAALTDGTKPRTHACYAYSQIATGAGNRTLPYSTDMTIDPHTYADLAKNGAVHYIGEVWCSVLWDMTWNIIQQVGYINQNLFIANARGGNSVALQLVITGMKLQPCSPGFIDSRNAILAADSILYGGLYKCAIWNAFARRGMGYSAQQGSSNSTSDQVAAYDVPCYGVYGRVVSPKNVAIPNITVTNTLGSTITNSVSTTAGLYGFTDCGYSSNVIRPQKTIETNKVNGVSVIDINLIQSHILGKSLLGSPYKIIAADVDNNNSVTALDILLLKRFILGLDTSFKSKRRWAFIDSSYAFPNPAKPFPYKDSILLKNFTTLKTAQSFIGVKLGDVNYDWNPALLRTTHQSLPQKPITLFYDNIIPSETIAPISIPIRAIDFKDMAALQFTLGFNSDVFSFQSIEPRALPIDYANNHAEEGLLSFLWSDALANPLSLSDSTILFTIQFRPKKQAPALLDFSLSSIITPIEAYNSRYQPVNIILQQGKMMERGKEDETIVLMDKRN